MPLYSQGGALVNRNIHWANSEPLSRAESDRMDSDRRANVHDGRRMGAENHGESTIDPNGGMPISDTATYSLIAAAAVGFWYMMRQ